VQKTFVLHTQNSTTFVLPTQKKPHKKQAQKSWKKRRQKGGKIRQQKSGKKVAKSSKKGDIKVYS